MINGIGLIVPIDVMAFCVGECDEQKATGSFSGMTTVYKSQVTKDHQAFLGKNVVKSLAESPNWQLKQGIHIHWALPDALTKTSVKDEVLDFPAAPNRWLLTRFIIKGTEVSARSWIIESDALSAADPNNQEAVTLPISTEDVKNFKYVGRWQKFDQNWRSLASEFKDITGYELSAVSSGDFSFAAYYPNCHSVFGFWDELEGVNATGDCPINLMYAVTGWHDRPENDPLNEEYVFSWEEIPGEDNIKLLEFLGAKLCIDWAKTAIIEKIDSDNIIKVYSEKKSILLKLNAEKTEVILEADGVGTDTLITKVEANKLNIYLKGAVLPHVQEAYGWTFKDRDNVAPSYAVYNGIIQGIEWNPNKKYVDDHKPLNASVSIGNNPAEAISAYLNSLLHPDSLLSEPLLNAFQMDILKKVQHPQPNRLEKLFESLHEKMFSSRDSGIIHTIVKRDCESEQETLIDLPPQLADDLNRLNKSQQEHDRAIAYLNELRWQLFADWYRIFMATNTHDLAFRVASFRYKEEYIETSKYISKISEDLIAQISAVEAEVKAQLGAEIMQKPAPRYYQPAEPVILIEGDEFVYPSRYGGDNHSGYLSSRLTDQVLKSVQIGGCRIDASLFAGMSLPEPNGLPHPDICSSLLIEACLLNTQLIAGLSGAVEGDLREALADLLAGHPQSTYLVSGYVPSSVGVNWWHENPWLPLFLCWTADFIPLQPTSKSQGLANYSAEFFTDNYEINPDAGGAIAYKPSGRAHSIHIDPATATSDQQYEGETLLQHSCAESLKKQFDEIANIADSPTLQSIKNHIESSNILIQPLSGLESAFLMRRLGLQLNIGVPSTSSYPIKILTRDIGKAIGEGKSTAPWFHWHFNPIRAGYLKNLRLNVVDVFGQKRDIKYESLICAESMVAYDENNKPAKSAVYLEPRISQPARLIFRWISSDSTGYEEMNSHPATSPICGWILPNHLDGSFFIYNQQGKPLGMIYLNGDKTEVKWQSAPGDDNTINQRVEEVLKYENLHLLKIAVALKNSDASFFTAFWNAVDMAHGSINPQNLSSNSSISVLIGRPVAIVQAMLRLEVEGRPALNQRWECFTENDYNETENKFTDVEFPVILGDLSQMDDGLIGYFKETLDGADYDLTTFYAESAAPSSSRVVQPAKANHLTLTVYPKLDPKPGSKGFNAMEAGTKKVLILMDPRGSLHITTGILPTKSLSIPSDMCESALQILEMSFPVNPVLVGKSGLSMPIPQENGYQFSWVKQVMANGAIPKWENISELIDVSSRSIWNYTPSRIADGWLKMNPILLEFALLNSSQQPVVAREVPNSLNLLITNRKQDNIEFRPGILAEENEPNTGSIFYIHLGDLAGQAAIPIIRFSAPGWDFKCFESPRFGQYWAGVPMSRIILKSGESTAIKIENLAASASGTSAHVYFDYYGIIGLNDGVYVELVAVQSGI